MPKRCHARHFVSQYLHSFFHRSWIRSIGVQLQALLVIEKRDVLVDFREAVLEAESGTLRVFLRVELWLCLLLI